MPPGGTTVAAATNVRGQVPLAACKETEHFIIQCHNEDATTLNELASTLEAAYAKACSDLGCSSQQTVSVEVYPDLTVFDAAMGVSDASPWLMGVASASTIRMVSPSNPGPAHTRGTVMQGTGRLVTQAIMQRVGGEGLPMWLLMGVADYEAGDRQSVVLSPIPDLSLVFGNVNYYPYGYYVVGFVVKQYGYDKLVQLIKAPDDIEGVFGLSQAQFQAKWKQYMAATYK